MKRQKRLWLKKNKKKRNEFFEDEVDLNNELVIKNKKLLKSKKFIKHKKANLNLYYILKFILAIILLISFLFFQKKKKENKTDYYACFSGMGKMENKYIRELIEYYLKLGVEKFI